MRLFLVALALWMMLVFILYGAAGSELCFLDRETESGLNKICFYACISGDAAITIKGTQLCPLSIKR
jgi:hypothetical protein